MALSDREVNQLRREASRLNRETTNMMELTLRFGRRKAYYAESLAINPSRRFADWADFCYLSAHVVNQSSKRDYPRAFSMTMISRFSSEEPAAATPTGTPSKRSRLDP